MANRSWPKRIWYEFLHVTSRMLAVVLLRVRCSGRENVPTQGGGLVLSNHQSHLDPVLVGLASDRRLNFLARETLFRFLPFRLLIQSLDAIPVDREGLGLGGLKETFRRLKRGELVLIFPEGTRTSDGEIAPLKPGFSALASRAKVPLIPVAIDGAFQVWPRWQLLPWPIGVVRIHFGPPIEPEELDQFDSREIVEEVQRRMIELHAQARAARLRAKRPVFARPV